MLTCTFLHLNISASLCEVLTKDMGNHFFATWKPVAIILSWNSKKNVGQLVIQFVKRKHVDCFSFEVEKFYTSNLLIFFFRIQIRECLIYSSQVVSNLCNNRVIFFSYRANICLTFDTTHNYFLVLSAVNWCSLLTVNFFKYLKAS